MKILTFLAAFVISCVGGLQPEIAHAKFISIRSEIVSIEVKGDNVAVRIKIENKGDESAHNVETNCSFLQNFTCTSVAKAVLPPSGVIDETISVALNSVRSGSYDGVLIIRYADANGYNLSATAPIGFSLGVVPRSLLSAFADEVSLRDKSQVKVPITVTNFGDTAQEGLLKVFAPLEFDVEPRIVKVVAPPKGKAEVYVTIKDVASLPGSAYPLNVVISSEENGVARSSRAIFMLRTLPPLVMWHYVLLAIGLIGCLALMRRSVEKRA